jgi:hypothetical protein
MLDVVQTTYGMYLQLIYFHQNLKRLILSHEDHPGVRKAYPKNMQAHPRAIDALPRVPETRP